MIYIYTILSVFLIFIGFENVSADEIDKLYQKVIESDYKLKSLLYREKAEDYKISQEKSKYKPQISFSSYLGWQEYKPYYGKTSQQTLRYYYLSLRQPIFHIEVFKSIYIAKIEKSIVTLRKIQEKQYITYLFFNTLYDYLYTKKQLQILQDQLKMYDKKLTFYKTLFENHKTTADTVLRISLQKKEIQQRIDYLKKQMISFKKGLEILTGIYIDKYLKDFEAKISIDFSEFPKEYFYWREKLSDNLEIKQAYEGIRMAKLEVEKRKTVRYPKVDAELSYRYASTSAVSVATEDKRAALIIDFPIYQGGFANAYILEAKQLLKAADMDYMQTKKEKQMQMKDIYIQYVQKIEEIKRQTEKEKILNDLKEKIKKEFENHLRTKLDLIDINIEILENQFRKAQSFQDFVDSYIKLLYVTGSISDEKIKTIKLFLQKHQ